MIALLATFYGLPAVIGFLALRRLIRPRTRRGWLILAAIAFCWPIWALIVIIGR